MFNGLPEGSLKEKLRAILCEAFEHQLDICDGGQQQAETEVANAPTKEASATSGSEKPERKVEVNFKKFESLAEAMKALQQALQSIKKLEQDRFDGKITQKKFDEDYATLSKEIKYAVLHAYRKFLKENFKLPKNIYRRDSQDFQTSWQQVFRDWAKTQPNKDKLIQTADEYAKVLKEIKKIEWK